MTFFEKSFEQWSRETGLSYSEWLDESRRRHERMRLSRHWHDGKPCKEVGCR